MYNLIKPLLFGLSAEKAHHLTTASFGAITSTPLLKSIVKGVFDLNETSLERELWGLKFKNPIGLAAGFDKNGEHINSMSKLGFGFIEVGTVTPLPQEGNPKPRLFRLIDDRGVINRMGFNNKGVDFLVEQLKKKRPADLIIGGNIGKNKVTPNEEAYKDYRICFEKLYPHVDYFVVNLSSPNTPGLRSLQEKGPLKKILSSLLEFKSQQSIKRPILLKIAPDLTTDALIDVIEIVEELEIEGLIATNTTISRSGLKTKEQDIENIGNGGLSGAPLTKRATEVIQEIRNRSKDLPIVGVGGIHSYETAAEKLNAGANLIQIYSGLIYEGPFLVKKIKKGLLASY